MYRLIVFICFTLLFSIICYAADNKSNNGNTKNIQKVPDASFNDDYIVGLKAFEDKLNDVAIASFNNYLAHENKSRKAGFALYLLYQLYMAESDYKSAQFSLSQLANFNDSRFNKQQMLKDQMFIETKLDCVGAKNLLMSARRNEYLEVYAKSSCPMDKDVISLINKIDVSTNALYAVLERVQDNKDLVFSTYDNLRADKRTPKLMNFYGKYFYTNNMKTEFMALYNSYKDSELTALVLDDIWNQKDYKKYINTFNKEVKSDYNMQKVVYCRMIEASNKEAFNFDCNLVDKCIGVNSPDYNKNKLACYMKKEDKENISWFIGTLTNQETIKLCEYGKYIIGKRLYDSKFVHKFAGCQDKASMYESLLKFKDYDSMIKLGGGAATDEDAAYMAIAYYYKGNTNQYNNYLSKVKDIDLSGMVKRTISRGGL